MEGGQGGRESQRERERKNRNRSEKETEREGHKESHRLSLDDTCRPDGLHLLRLSDQRGALGPCEARTRPYHRVYPISKRFRFTGFSGYLQLLRGSHGSGITVVACAQTTGRSLKQRRGAFDHKPLEPRETVLFSIMLCT